MLNRKGDDQVSVANIIYVILLAIFALTMFLFVQSNQNGAKLLEDVYSKEIAKVINSAEPGDKIRLDVHGAVALAVENDVSSYSDIFRIDDSENRICVRLSRSNSRTCYIYFNDVDVINLDLVLADPTNYLIFEIVENRGQENE